MSVNQYNINAVKVDFSAIAFLFCYVDSINETRDVKRLDKLDEDMERQLETDIMSSHHLLSKLASSHLEAEPL